MNKKLYFLEQFAKSIENETFCKLTLSKNVGLESDLKNIFIKPVIIKKEQKLSFTYRNKTKDIVKNYSKIEAVEKLNEYINVNYFTIVNFLSSEQTDQLMINKNGKICYNSSKINQKINISTNHDLQKIRKIDSKGKYLFDLKITDVNGVVFKNAQDKYKQINHYVELLAPLLEELPKFATTNVVDMGSGKGYLTFALYDFMANNLGIKTKAIGVEFRPDMVKLCNEIAQKAEFSNLTFSEGTILDYDATNANVLIALHACDTATDDAIYKGITANTDLIVVAPCCHKQIRREMEKGKAKNDLNFLTNHGIFMERQAEMVTDGLRALILEYNGYKTKVFQFISDAHTPKNVMITAIKNQNLNTKNKEKDEVKKAEILEKIKNTKAYFGIGEVYLETLFLQ